MLRVLFRFRSTNTEVLKTPGPLLLLANHVSWIDWLFILADLDGDWRFISSSTTAQTSWLHRYLMVNERTYPIDPGSPYSLKRVAEHLAAGGRFLIFPEGRLTQTGSLMRIFEGTSLLLQKSRARVIFCYLRGTERVLFSPHSGWKKIFPKISAHYSEVKQPPVITGLSGLETRRRLTHWIRQEMITQRFDVEMELGPSTVLLAAAEAARTHPHADALEDASYKSLTFREVFVRADLLAGRWAELCSADARVGVLLPNVNAAPIVFLSLWIAGRVPAVLNFTTGTAMMIACIQLAGLRRIITSRAFIERQKMDLSPFEMAGIQFLFLEEVAQQIPPSSKLARALVHRFLPWTQMRYTPFADTAVILFTSGSEGQPKAVELTHRNLLANIRQILSAADISDRDRFFSCLPLFHSAGFVIGMLLPLIRGIYCFLYPNPLHYRLVPMLFSDRNCTILISTNTFLNGYARKAHSYDFRSLRCLFAGAEKVQESTAAIWGRRFGVRILEAYGATECSPIVSFNTPCDTIPGTAGRLLPRIEWKLESVEGVPEGGRLFVRGPNIMKGYLNPEANAQFQALGGWYDTGDIVRVDADNCIHVLGRLKRFAKISGEMVSLTAVEEALAGAFVHLGANTEVAIATRPDADKGEILIAITNSPALTLEEIRTAIRSKGLTNLCLPRELKLVRDIPKLGTGKVNHRELQKLV
ncbi:MAG: AMP-dependent synthetase [Pedosphaera sp.]|nr:AMP-dependent synthetase [Pedosphaera sp.]